jgi:hypothetical protein
MPFAEAKLSPTTSSMGPRLGLPSWLISICAHLLVLVLLGLFVRGPRRGIADEPDRDVGIVLSAAAEVGDAQYFDRPSESASTATSPSVAEKAVLPDLSEQPLEQALDTLLPGTTADGFDSADLLAEPALSGGRGRIPDGRSAEDVIVEDSEFRDRSGPTGPVTSVSLFGSAPAAGRTFVFVIDRSNSMGGDGLGALSLAEREFNAAFSSLQPTHKFQIVAYHHKRVFFGDRELVPATDTNKQRVSQFMRGLAAFGGTDHLMALTAALSFDPDVVFLLTDGGDPRLTKAHLTQVRRRAGARTTIHCIQFGFGPLQDDNPFMERLARENGGSYRYVDVSVVRRQ